MLILLCALDVDVLLFLLSFLTFLLGHMGKIHTACELALIKNKPDDINIFRCLSFPTRCFEAFTNQMVILTNQTLEVTVLVLSVREEI